MSLSYLFGGVIPLVTFMYSNTFLPVLVLGGGLLSLPHLPRLGSILSEHRWMLGLVGLFLLSPLWSTQPLASTIVIAKFSGLMLAGGTWFMAQQRAPLPPTVLTGFFISLVCLQIIAFIDTTLGHPLVIELSKASSPKLYGPLMVLAVSSFPLIFLDKQSWGRKAALIGVILFPVFFIDFDIAKVIALLVPVFIFAAWIQKWRWAHIYVSIATFIKCLSWPFVFGLTLTPEHITAFNKVVPIFSYVHRLHIWAYLSQKFTQRPWLGYGIGTSSQYKIAGPSTYDWVFIEHNGLLKAVHHETGGYPLFHHAHNGLIQLAYETGIVGLALFSALMAYIVWRLGDLPYVQRCVGWCIFGAFFMVMLTTLDLFHSWWISLYWIILVLGAKAFFHGPIQAEKLGLKVYDE